MGGTVKILSIDGGGIRGVIPAMLLAEIERRIQRPAAELFDLVAGTSTGGILALGLTVPKIPGEAVYSAKQLVDMYEREGRCIFSRSTWHRFIACGNLAHEKYPCAGIEQVLWKYFGDSRLRDAKADVLIASYEIERSLPFFFRSCMARKRSDYDFAARDVARSTSAAPTYFTPMKLPTGTNSDYYTLIDGGVFANNPAACALVEALTTHPGAERFLVVSLRTGELNYSFPYDSAKNWGLAKWAMPVLDIVFDGVSKTVDYQLRRLLPNIAGQCQRYFRLQATLDGRTHGLDDASPANITALKALAYELVEEKSDEIDAICEAVMK